MKKVIILCAFSDLCGFSTNATCFHPFPQSPGHSLSFFQFLPYIVHFVFVNHSSSIISASSTLHPTINSLSIKSFETVIFDMDGVIIDSEPVHMNIEQQLYREQGLEISEEEHQQFVGTSTLEMWTSLVDKYNLDVSAGEISEEKHRRYLHWLESANTLPIINGVRKLINQLHQSGKTLCLASSSSMQEIDCVLAKLQLESFFSFRVSGADLPHSKPNPMIFLKAAELARTSPARCCVIEDSRNGVTAAKAAGMFCIGYQNTGSGSQDLSSADLVTDDFNSLDIERVFGG